MDHLIRTEETRLCVSGSINNVSISSSDSVTLCSYSSVFKVSQVSLHVKAPKM